jgi:hypothetical protein
MAWTLPPQPALATDRFILILNALWAYVGTKAGPAMTSALHLAIRKRLSRIRTRFASLAARFHAGTLTPPKPRASPRAHPDGAAPKARVPSILPRGFAWLCGLVPCWAAGCGSQMQHLLDDPELRAMAAASPEVGKLVRSLLWMTGRVHPDFPGAPRGRPARAGRSGGRQVSPEPEVPTSVPVENPPAAPPPQPPAALLVTPVIDTEMWSHYRLYPVARRKGW